MVLGQLTNTVDGIDGLNPGFEGKLGAGRINASKAFQPAAPIVSYAGYSVNGTPNGRPDFNADVSLTVSLNNDWADALGVSAVLSTADPLVSVTTGSATFGDILSGQTRSNSMPYAIHIATAAGYNHAIPFSLAVSANGGTFTKILSFTVTTRSSEEVVFGTIIEDTVWTSDKTYKVTNNVGIPPGVTLTIQPGTVVKFAGNFALNVSGTLIANGTADQPIQFQPFTAGQTWSRIIMNDYAQDGVSGVDGGYISGTSLSYVSIQGAASGLQCTNATPRLSNLTITAGGISCTLGSTPFNLPDSTITGNVSAGGYSSVSPIDYRVTGTTITGSLSLPVKSLITGSNVSGGITVGAQSQVTFNTTGGISTGMSSTVEDNLVNGSVVLGSGTAQRNQISGGNLTGGAGVVFNQNTVSHGGINADSGSSVTGNSVENSPAVGLQAGSGSIVTGNRIVGAAGHGITATTGTIAGNLVANIGGDGLRAGAATIQNNTFTGIKGNGVYLNGLPVKLENNNFELNTGTYDLYNDNPAGQNTLAPNNWWGTTTTATIRSRIFDFMIDMEKGSVSFTPVLTGPAQTAPAYVRSITLDPPSPVGIQTVNFTVEYSRPMDVSKNPRISFGMPFEGTWQPMSSMASPRDQMGVATASNGKIYVIGGYFVTSINTVSKILDTVEEYNPATNTWMTKASMPTARTGLGVAAASNGKIYAMGGTNQNNAVVKTVEEYDPFTNTWATKADLPTTRPGLGVATASNGKIYAIGGRDQNNAAVNTVEEYDPATNNWTTKASMPTARSGPDVAAASNGKLYAIGGNDNNGALATVEEYSPATNTWTTKANMPSLQPGAGVAAASNGKIYLIGGFSPGDGNPY